MDDKKMKKLTVGDMSGCNRSGERCHVVRESVGEIAVGEAVLIRFKGDCGDITPWRRYKLEEKYFRDEYDAARLRYTGTFVRVTTRKAKPRNARQQKSKSRRGGEQPGNISTEL